MEKYGVEEEEEKNKTAGNKKHCPDCGAVIEDMDNTGILVCPKCGTKPWEKK